MGIFNSSICIFSNLKATKMPFNKWMNKLWYIQMTDYAKKKVSYQAMEKHGGNSSIPLLHGWSQLERITWCVSLTTDGPQVVMTLLMLFFFFSFYNSAKGICIQ